MSIKFAKWTGAEDEALRQLSAANADLTGMASDINRPMGGIVCRLIFLKLPPAKGVAREDRPGHGDFKFEKFLLHKVRGATTKHLKDLARAGHDPAFTERRMKPMHTRCLIPPVNHSSAGSPAAMCAEIQG